MTLEKAFEELEVIIEKMNDREVSLDDSFALYAEGTKLLKYCNEQLDMVEKKMLVLSEEGELHEF
ncbi:MAG: exodeoxyribonuclease VII small subunit [Lachnospiraceae bacterium]|nr:exodeoxyribonuclease VII small subunit [Lachnospiraceae bacterium]